MEGASHTPELVEGIINNQDVLNVSEIWLVDTDDGEELSVIENPAKRMVEKAQCSIKIMVTLDRREEIKDATYVMTQIRMGQLKMRRNDEYVSFKHGVIGQETTGGRWLHESLRTVQIMLYICKDIEELAPDAWIDVQKVARNEFETQSVN